MKKILIKASAVLCLAAAMLFGMGTLENKVYAAEVGQQLLHPEGGWQRFDDNDGRLCYSPEWLHWNTMDNEACNLTWSASTTVNKPVTIKFNGTKLRIIGAANNTNKYYGCPSIRVTIDNSVEYYSGNRSLCYKTLLYEKQGLRPGDHTVTIENAANGFIWFDAIDIDADGKLLNANPVKVSDIKLNKTEMIMDVDDIQDLTASISPSDATNQSVTWTSNNTKVCTVDKNGKVTAVGEGDSAVTAVANDGSGRSVSCYIKVVDNSRATLTINMNNGKEFNYNLSMHDIRAFDTWYMNRANGQGALFYKLTLDNGDFHTVNYNNISDYIVHKYKN